MTLWLQTLPRWLNICFQLLTSKRHNNVTLYSIPYLPHKSPWCFNPSKVLIREDGTERLMGEGVVLRPASSPYASPTYETRGYHRHPPYIYINLLNHPSWLNLLDVSYGRQQGFSAIGSMAMVDSGKQCCKILNIGSCLALGCLGIEQHLPLSAGAMGGTRGSRGGNWGNYFMLVVPS